MLTHLYQKIYPVHIKIKPLMLHDISLISSKIERMKRSVQPENSNTKKKMWTSLNLKAEKTFDEFRMAKE